MTDKRLTLIGFAAKAGRLSYGMNAAVAAILKGNAKLILVAEDISQKSRKELCFQAEKKNTPLRILTGCDIKTVSDAVGRKCGILSVNDSQFADAVLTATETGGNAT